MVFAQAAPPVDWTLDITDNDRFLRVVNTTGGGVAGPVNLATGSNNQTLNHSHANSHSHSMQGHSHSITHTHLLGVPNTGNNSGFTQDMSIGLDPTATDYKIRDNVSPFWFTVSGNHHLVVDGGNVNEGNHNHVIDPTTEASPVTSLTTSESTPATDPSTSLIDLAHSHSVDGNFKPAYVDVIIATLTK